MPTFLASAWAFVRSRISGAWTWMFAHKVWATVIVVAVLGGGYYTYAHYFKSSGATQYVLAAASRGDLVVNVSGSGQVQANQTLDLSPKASGTVTYVGVKAGDTVRAGTVIARIDDTDAEKSLRDAQISYEESLASSNTSVSKALDTAITTGGSVTSDLPDIIHNLDTALHDTSTIPTHTVQENENAYASIIGGQQGSDMRDKAEASYTAALDAYKALLTLSAKTSRTSSSADIDAYITNAYAAATAASEATSDVRDILTIVNDKLVRAGTTIPASFTTISTNAGSDDSKASSDVSSALSAKDGLESAIQSGAGSSVPLDLQKAQNSLADARAALADYVVVAPIDGTIGKVNVQTHDTAGGSTAVATLVTTGQYAELSLNEVDAAKVKSGQKAELTFDAIDGLTLSGTVAEIDSVGTVSSGVVTYAVKISFDTQDDRVKPGMTVDASITTDSKQGALIVPSSAVTTTAGRSYVQVATLGTSTAAPTTASTTGFRNRFASTTVAGFASTTGRFRNASSSGSFTASGTAGFARTSGTQTVDASEVTITRVPVEVGLTNDTQTEIVSGITDGTLVVSRTTSGTTATAATSATTRTTGGFGGAGAARAGGGNAVFIPRGG